MPSVTLILVIVVFLALLMAFLLRGALARVGKSVLLKLQPRWLVWRLDSGTLLGKCPRCGAQIRYDEPKPEEAAFICASCGERGELK